MSVFFDNELDKPIPDNYEEIVRDIIDASLDYLDCPYECEINVIFTDNKGIQLINKEHRDIDSPTDVLSFPMADYDVPGEFTHLEAYPLDYFNQDTGELMLGDIILNIDRIASQAEDYGHTRRREIAFLTAHSMLHLAGYDHMEEEEKKVMRAKEEQVLLSQNITRGID